MVYNRNLDLKNRSCSLVSYLYHALLWLESYWFQIQNPGVKSPVIADIFQSLLNHFRKDILRQHLILNNCNRVNIETCSRRCNHPKCSTRLYTWEIYMTAVPKTIVKTRKLSCVFVTENVNAITLFEIYWEKNHRLEDRFPKHYYSVKKTLIQVLSERQLYPYPEKYTRSPISLFWPIWWARYFVYDWTLLSFFGPWTKIKILKCYCQSA